jgi:hypothetical protein
MGTNGIQSSKYFQKLSNRFLLMCQKAIPNPVKHKTGSIQGQALFGGRVVVFICPTCFTQYEYSWEASARFVPHCDYCGVQLIRTEVW